MTDFTGKKTAVALGNFDGLHKGHLAVINEAVIQKHNGLLPVVLIFNIHPRQKLSGNAPKKIMTVASQIKEISKLGATVEILDFEDVMNMSPEEFVRDVLIEKFNAAYVSCGFNFRFGKNGAGNTRILNELCEKHSVKLSVANEQTADGECISSTKIRNALQNGEIERANTMLGRHFSYDFEVVHGAGIGAKLIGFPTINQIFPEDHIVPKSGAYSSAAVIDGKLYPAMTNIGIRPTVGGTQTRSETFILGFSGDLYGTNTQVKLISYIREEKKFPSLEALSAQLKKDSVKAEMIYNEVFR